MAGFCSIIKDEKDLKVKNVMLEYLTDLMEDVQGFLAGPQPRVLTLSSFVGRRRARLTG